MIRLECSGAQYVGVIFCDSIQPMKEKLLWSSVFLLSLMLLATHAQPPSRAESQVGRYQIVVVPGNQSTDWQAFRIDTVTGRTWFGKTSSKVGWFDMSENGTK